MKYWALAGLVIASGMLCFILPWVVPPNQDGSESAAWGFSNLTFIACVVGVFIPTVFWVGLRLPALRGQSQDPVGSPVGRQSGTIFESVWLEVTAWLLFVAVSAMLLAANSYPASFFPGESDYILRRTVLFERGAHPYRDFEYAYGPLFIQGLAWLHSSGLSLHLANALLIIGESLIGLLSVRYLLIHVFQHHYRKARLIFLLLTIGACNLLCVYASQSYTYLRYASPILFAYLILHRFGAARVMVAAWAGPVHAFAWWISPEVGLAVALAFVIIVVLRASDRLRCLALSSASLLLCALILPDYTDSYRALWEFARGSGTPLFRSSASLIFLGFIGAATWRMGNRPDAAAPQLQFLYLVSLGMLPGAANQFSYIHAMYGFGFIVLASHFVLGLRLPGLFALLPPIALSLSTLKLLQVDLPVLAAEMSQQALAALGARGDENRLREHLSYLPKEYAEKVMEKRSELLGELVPGPYPFISPHVFFEAHPAYYAQSIKPGYFVDIVNIFSHAAHRRLMEDIRGKRVVLSRNDWEAIKNQDIGTLPVSRVRVMRFLDRRYDPTKVSRSQFNAFLKQHCRESGIKAPDGYVYIDIPDIEYRPRALPQQ